MGCKESKQVRIQPVGQAELKLDNTKLRKTTSEISEFDIDEKTGEKTKKNKSRKNRNKSSKGSRNNNSLGSCASLDDRGSIEDSDRGFSAGSKFSKQSTDSGLGGDYENVITEYSDPDSVKKIEDGFIENPSLDLGITGTACQNRVSAKNRERMEEAMVMQTLREEGLITKPEKHTQAGTAFEIIDVSNQDGIVRPPPRLAKLERRRKKKRQLTEDEIREKLEKAERRKKRKEQERLEKIKEHESKNNMSVNLALEQFEQLQKEKENVSVKKLDQVSDNREKRLREIREKMKERERRAELVRQRKEKAIQEGTYVSPRGEFPPEAEK